MTSMSSVLVRMKKNGAKTSFSNKGPKRISMVSVFVIKTSNWIIAGFLFVYSMSDNQIFSCAHSISVKEILAKLLSL